MRYLDEWKSFGKLRFSKTNEYQVYEERKRRVYKSDVLFITATYEPGVYSTLFEFWQKCGNDFNRWFTSVKSRLRTRQISILYYFRAWESQGNGRPHIHLMLKLSKPLKFYKQYIPDLKDTRFILLPNECESLAGRKHYIDKYFFNWREGGTRAFGVSPPKGAKRDRTPFEYIAKYITKVYNPEWETQKSLLTQALCWVLRKRAFSHTRLNILDHLALRQLDPKRATLKEREHLNYHLKNIPVKQIAMTNHLNNGKLYQVIGFRRGSVFFPYYGDTPLWDFDILAILKMVDHLNYIREMIWVNRFNPIIYLQRQFPRWVKRISSS